MPGSAARPAGVTARRARTAAVTSRIARFIETSGGPGYAGASTGSAGSPETVVRCMSRLWLVVS